MDGDWISAGKSRLAIETLKHHAEKEVTSYQSRICRRELSKRGTKGITMGYIQEQIKQHFQEKSHTLVTCITALLGINGDFAAASLLYSLNI